MSSHHPYLVEVDFSVLLGVLLGVLLVVVLQLEVVLSVVDFWVDFAVVFAVVLGVVLEVVLAVVFGVVDVLQLVVTGHFHPTHLEDVVLILELVFELDDVGVDEGGTEDVNSGGSHGSVDSRFFAT